MSRTSATNTRVLLHCLYFVTFALVGTSDASACRTRSMKAKGYVNEGHIEPEPKDSEVPECNETKYRHEGYSSDYDPYTLQNRIAPLTSISSYINYFIMWQTAWAFPRPANTCISPSLPSASPSRHWRKNWISSYLSEAPKKWRWQRQVKSY